MRWQTAFLVSLVVTFVPTTEAQIPQIEREALIAIYEQTAGAGWSDRSNWRNPGDTDFNDPGTECTWYGVTCARHGGSVLEVSLSSNNLVGSIPPELGNLDQLQRLFLQSNQLSGSIPIEIANLGSLQWLTLGLNPLTGNIPPELGDLRSLMGLNLGYSQLTGSIPPSLGNLTDLRVLGLQGNQLSGPIPPELGNIQKLTQIILSWNHLTGAIPPELNNISALQFLYVHANQLAGELPNLSGANLGQIGPSVEIGENALFSTDPTTSAYWDVVRPGWNYAQTVAPAWVQIELASPSGILVNWAPMSYQFGPGGYLVEYATSASGPYSSSIVAGKTTTTLALEGYSLGTTFFVRISSVSDPNTSNIDNTVTSLPSADVSITITEPAFSVGDILVLEGDGGTTTASFTVSLNMPAPTRVEVGFATSDGSAQAGSDYVALSGTAIIETGSSSTTVDVEVLTDSVGEPDEIFYLQLSDPVGAILSDASGIAVIANDDGLCPDFVIDYTTIFATEVYDACGNVILGPDLVVTATADLTVTSPGSIGLESGFSIESGATVHLGTQQP